MSLIYFKDKSALENYRRVFVVVSSRCQGRHTGNTLVVSELGRPKQEDP